MQAFDALFGGQRVNSARNTTPDTSRSSNAQDDAGATGGFDRMLQAQGSRNVASNPSPRTSESPNASMQAQVKNASPRDAESPRASEESKSSETKSNETKSNDASRETARAESKDDAPRDASDGASEPDTAATASEDTTAASDSAAPAPTATTSDAATPALPEQMLALLNGLAGAGAAPAATAASTEALPPGLLRGDAVATATDPRGGNATATAQVLPTLAAAQATTTAPIEGDATAAFAMAMGAAASADTKTSGATDAALDAIGIGETASTSTSLPSVSTMTNHPLPRGVAAAVQANTPIPLDNGFDDGFSSRIAWLADQKIGHAEIRITPDHLGAIDVRLQLDGNRVNAEFHSAQPDVRHALESSLPRLKEMLGQQGLQLGQADVGQRQAQQQGASNGQAGSFGGSNERGEAANDAGWSRGPAVRASRGLLDEYA